MPFCIVGLNLMIPNAIPKSNDGTGWGKGALPLLRLWRRINEIEALASKKQINVGEIRDLFAFRVNYYIEIKIYVV